MAKALFGHVGLAADQRLVDEARRLRRQVDDLQLELARAHAANDALVASVHVEDDVRMLTLQDEPALT